ncbi:hypothetical protein Spb1_18220 [Planctopirus ephydatiae]|uniref:Uncharacterized protein n=2 Tax=Planctopirus ephydatiae TaxID=2528019 RepID=A0A518GML9_9PLAN|nr:hypothetical protein Spb1_18220 [Planctopirus ephydatiae]
MEFHNVEVPLMDNTARTCAAGSSRREWMRTALGFSALAAFGSAPGCSLFVMAGKMVQGDPKHTCRFKAMTGIDLTKGKHKIMVVCSTPADLKQENSSLEYDLIDGITRRMKRRKVDAVDPKKITKWLDDHGGIDGDLTDISQDIETNYIAWVNVHRFQTTEDNAPRLHRGRMLAEVSAFEVQDLGGRKFPSQIFTTEFNSTYPEHQPISENGRSALVFQKEYLDRVSEMLGEIFFDKSLNDTL